MSPPGPATSAASDASRYTTTAATPAVISDEVAQLKQQLAQTMRETATARADTERVKAMQAHLVAVACHDLCQPLQALILLLEALRGQLAGTRLEEVTDTMQLAADDLIWQIDSLAKIAALDASLLIPTSKMTSLEAILRHLEADL